MFRRARLISTMEIASTAPGIGVTLQLYSNGKVKWRGHGMLLHSGYVTADGGGIRPDGTKIRKPE